MEVHNVICLSEIQGVYRHFKGEEYVLTDIVYDERNREVMVLYYEKKPHGITWVKPYTEFFEHVEEAGYSGPRFIKIEEKNNFWG